MSDSVTWTCHFRPFPLDPLNPLPFLDDADAVSDVICPGS